MPVMKDEKGHSIYVLVRDFYTQRPQDFFTDDEFEIRQSEARQRIFTAIRFASIPLCGRGNNHGVRISDHQNKIDELTDFVNAIDMRRIRQVVAQRKREKKNGLAPTEHRLKSPQNLRRRRSALFGGKDIPEDFVHLLWEFKKKSMILFFQDMNEFASLI